MDLAYRVSQFWQLLTAEPLDKEARSEIEAVLSREEVKLFRQHTVSDQRHAYRTMRLLRESGHDQRPLLAAALLHDIGKTRVRPGIWERIVGAVVEAFCPACVRKWGRGPAEGWRRPFAIRARHPEWGAAMVEGAGSPPLTVALIRHHQEKTLPAELGNEEMARLLRLLQWADDQT